MAHCVRVGEFQLRALPQPAARKKWRFFRFTQIGDMLDFMDNIEADERTLIVGGGFTLAPVAARRGACGLDALQLPQQRRQPARGVSERAEHPARDRPRGRKGAAAGDHTRQHRGRRRGARRRLARHAMQPQGRGTARHVLAQADWAGADAASAAVCAGVAGLPPRQALRPASPRPTPRPVHEGRAYSRDIQRHTLRRHANHYTRRHEAAGARDQPALPDEPARPDRQVPLRGHTHARPRDAPADKMGARVRRERQHRHDLRFM